MSNLYCSVVFVLPPVVEAGSQQAAQCCHLLAFISTTVRVPNMAEEEFVLLSQESSWPPRILVWLCNIYMSLEHTVVLLGVCAVLMSGSFRFLP